MLSALFLLASVQSPSTKALMQLEGFMSRNTALKLEMNYSNGSRQTSLVYCRTPDGQRQLFRFLERKLDVFRFPKTLYEIDRRDDFYDVQAWQGYGVVPIARIDWATNVFPAMLLSRPASSLAAAPGGWKVSQSGENTTLINLVETRDGTSKVTITINKSGVPGSVSIVSTGMMSVSEKWTIKSAGTPSAAELNMLSKEEPSIPDGFTPYVLSPEGEPISLGAKLPMQGWESSRGRVADLTSRMRGDRLLIAYVSLSGAANKEIIPWLEKIKGTVASVTISAEGDGGDVFAANGNVLTALGPAPTPTLYLVDKSGTVLGLWQGFDPNLTERYLKEIVEALGN